MATLSEHKALIEAAVTAAESDGFVVSIESDCQGCCCGYTVELYRPYSPDEIVKLEIEI